MPKINESFRNASVLMAGMPAMALVVLHFCTDNIPGLHHLAGLCMPMICVWAGMLVRESTGKPKAWVPISLFLLALVLLCLSGRPGCLWWETIPCLYLSCILLGYTVPDSSKENVPGAEGWTALAMLVLTAICYTAVSASAQRVDLIRPETAGTKAAIILMKAWLKAAEVALVPVTACFAVRFCHSEVGQWLGGRAEMRWVAGASLVLLYIFSVRNLVLSHGFWFRGELGHLIFLLVQPVTIYLAVIAVRILRKPFRKDGTPWAWKEILSI